MKISVVIRTRDKEKHLESLLEDLSLQTVHVSEISVVNNYSNERKLRDFENALCETFRKWFSGQKTILKLINLPDNEFSHAYSTNLGVAATENEIVCITNAHSLPISNYWLQDGVRHFADPKVAGVIGFFIPHKERGISWKFNVAIYYISQTMAVRQNRFSTINCIIRKSFWRAYPFDENLLKIIPEAKRYGLEDYDWSKEMMERGFKIITEPSFSVFHSHSKGLDEMSRNVRNYFIYRKIQRKVNLLDRPRRSFSRVFQSENATSKIAKICVA